MTLIAELRRRNVFRVAAIYGVVGWLLAQVAVILESTLTLPDWFDTFVVVTLLIGFPVAILLAWAFELTPDGFRPTPKTDDATAPERRRATKRSLNGILAAALALALAFIAYDGLVVDRRVPFEALSPREASIAVIPFADMSADGDQTYFCDGIAEELLNLLAKVDGLRVASRTSSFAFRGDATPLSQIAGELGVAHVLEGSVRKSGDQVRITAQLIDARSDEHIWSDTYDRQLTAQNLFAIQDEIAAAIVKEVGGQLEFTPRESLPTESTRAYEYYLSGIAKVATRSREDLRAGIEDMLAAVAIDPDFAEAHFQLSKSFTLARSYGAWDAEEADRRANEHLETARRLLPGSPWLTIADAWNLYGTDAPLADQVAAFERAVELNSMQPDAWQGYSAVLNDVGRWEDSVAALDRALEIEPDNSILLINRAGREMQKGNIAAARPYLDRILARDPDNVLARNYLASIALEEGDFVDGFRMAMATEGQLYSDMIIYDLLAILGLPDEVAKRSPQYGQLLRAVLDGDKDAIGDLLDQPDVMHSDVVWYWMPLIDDPDTILRIVGERRGGLSAIAPGTPVGSFTNASYALEAERAYAATDAEAAREIAGRLDRFMESDTAKDAHYAYDIFKVARWQASRGRHVEAIQTLRDLLDLNVPLAFYLEASEFDAMRDMVEFRDVSAQHEALQADLRAEIVSLLADPPEPWWDWEGTR